MHTEIMGNKLPVLTTTTLCHVCVTQGAVQRVSGHIQELEGQLMNMTPVARDEATLNRQLRQTEVRTLTLA